MNKLKLRIKWSWNNQEYIMQKKGWLFWKRITNYSWNILHWKDKTWEQAKKEAVEFMNDYYIKNVKKIEVDKSKVIMKQTKKPM